MTEQAPELPESIEYAGFWTRFGATLVDTLVLLLVTVPLMMVIYGNEMWQDGTKVLGGWDILINWLFPVVFVILFWRYRGATPGKMLTSVQVVDARTGQIPGFRQSAIRYLGYFLSTIPLMLGFFWIAIDKRKQGWHDKLAGTVVIKRKKTDST
ncbi:branched-chain amino acid aminotransferase I [Endozoicomonas montiporae]|uniref:Branched-chain amino acid aminotransferase I n=2 Tax=Endozoicomonas montiporae TaxID=1027273 RepID=A0A081N0K4_9GAMM|nr:branched-chain amino acid aminotransferase I [Endozoicomonas montiporae]